MNEFVRAMIKKSNMPDHYLALYANKYNQWLPPGGKVEPGETPLQALLRELVEEVGTGISSAELFCDKIFDFGPRGIWRGYLFAVSLDREPSNIEKTKHARIEYVHFSLFHPEYHPNLRNR